MLNCYLDAGLFFGRGYISLLCLDCSIQKFLRGSCCKAAIYDEAKINLDHRIHSGWLKNTLRDPGLGMPIHPNSPEETPRYLQHYCVHKRHQQTFSLWFFISFQIYAKGYQVVHSAFISGKQFCHRNSIYCLHTPKCQRGSQGQLLSKQVHHDYDWLLSPKLMCRTDYLNHFPSTDHSTRGPDHIATHFGSCPVFFKMCTLWIQDHQRGCTKIKVLVSKTMQLVKYKLKPFENMYGWMHLYMDTLPARGLQNLKVLY